MKHRFTAAVLAAVLTPAAADALSVGMVRVSAPTRITASDGAAGHQYGVSVGIAGTSAIVGAVFDDAKGTNSGSAHLIDTTSGAQTKRTATDGMIGHWFGRSVGVSSATAIVGAPLDDDNGPGSGSAYLFNTTTGAETHKITARDGITGDYFGWSVGVSGTTAIVGAYRDSYDQSINGSAYLFNTITGAETRKLTASDGATDDYFGYSVGISGTTAIVGAFRDDDEGSNTGSAYLFDTTTGKESRKLTASDGAAGDNFGVSVGVSDTIAIVGADSDDDNGTNSGAAYIFDITAGSETKLTASDGAAFDYFGWSVAISDRFALVGAPDGGADNRGSAYLFDVYTGVELLKILIPDTASIDFGHSVALFEDQLMIGDPRYINRFGVQTGAAYLYQIEVIPLPAGFWLLLSCVGGVALMRRSAARPA